MSCVRFVEPESDHTALASAMTPVGGRKASLLGVKEHEDGKVRKSWFTVTPPLHRLRSVFLR